MTDRMDRGSFLRKLLFVDQVREAASRHPAVGPPLVVRPPRALIEPAFLARCTRCDLCIQACPPAILAGTSEPIFAPGTPVVDFSRGACDLCFKCVEACPEGALSPEEETRMGTAVVNPYTCLSTSSLECTLCLDACPLGQEAIRGCPGGGISVIAESCTGCGFCLRACPTEPKSIRISGRPAVPLRGHPPAPVRRKIPPR